MDGYRVKSGPSPQQRCFILKVAGMRGKMVPIPEFTSDSELLKYIFELGSSPPLLLYHYTSQEGLLGILKDKSLRMSSIFHLSDAAEYSYALQMVQDTIWARGARHPLLKLYDGLHDALSVLLEMSLYVCSFSGVGDLLSQWRAYTPNGIGYSIGFEASFLKQRAQAQGFGLAPCMYDVDFQRALVEKLLDLIGASYEEGKDDVMDGLKFRFSSALLRFAPLFKDPSFKEEMEWRVISQVNRSSVATAEFRPGKSTLIPFQRFDLQDENQKVRIGQVYVGPNPHLDLSVDTIRFLFACKEVSGPRQVEASSTPYRSW
jgi:hypothetical protein